MKKSVRLAAIAVCIAIGLAASVPSSAQSQVTAYRSEATLDSYFTPTDFPCLDETVHVFGTIEDYSVEVINPQGIGHMIDHETPHLAAVGTVTGKTYHTSGPLTFTSSGYSASVNPFETTFSNILTLIGPGELGKVHFRMLVHSTYDRTTGDAKLEIVKQDIVCR